eukprot:COSAG04_NODE_270_length_18507_cov_125.250380_7_plen_80_part_00
MKAQPPSEQMGAAHRIRRVEELLEAVVVVLGHALHGAKRPERPVAPAARSRHHCRAPADIAPRLRAQKSEAAAGSSIEP